MSEPFWHLFLYIFNKQYLAITFCVLFCISDTWHILWSFVCLIVADVQNNDVCRASSARWMPLHASVWWRHTKRFIVIVSGISAHLKSWRVGSHQSQLPGVSWLKGLFISLLLTTLSILFKHFKAGKKTLLCFLTHNRKCSMRSCEETPASADLHQSTLLRCAVWVRWKLFLLVNYPFKDSQVPSMHWSIDTLCCWLQIVCWLKFVSLTGSFVM